MADSRQRYVICYDIADDRRRRRVAECLEGYGERVQDSVFEAMLDRRLLDKLMELVKPNLDDGEDRLVIYSLCRACDGRRIDLGVAAAAPRVGDPLVIIV